MGISAVLLHPYVVVGNLWLFLSLIYAYPIYAYLVRSVQNRCRNHLRGLHLQEVPLSEVQELLLVIRENQLEETPYPLAHLENKEFQ